MGLLYIGTQQLVWPCTQANQAAARYPRSYPSDPQWCVQSVCVSLQYEPAGGYQPLYMWGFGDMDMGAGSTPPMRQGDGYALPQYPAPTLIVTEG